ncbi:MAG: hypothetical protein SFV19_08175 [Rhodospirillaceae bacterium]|nr:hypothetical protein [Rhodospirillaceae bacterium]
MKRENLYFVGAALMASTSLSTAASAGTFYVVPGGVTLNDTISSAARNLSAQAFGSSPSTATTLGSASIVYKFNAPVQSDNTNITIGVTGAQFTVSSIPAGVIPLNFAAATSNTVFTIAAATSTLCSVQGGTQKIIITNCSFSTAAGTLVSGSAGGVLMNGITFDNATGLATPGGAIALDATVTIGTTTLETTAAQNGIVSRNSVLTTIAPVSPINTINVSAVPAFSSITTNGLSVTIATVTVTLNSAVGANLTTAVGATNATGAANEIKLTSAALTNAGFAGVNLGGTALSSGLTQATSGSVTFTVPAASIINTFSLNVQFTGAVAIPEAAAGTATATYAAFGGTASTGNVSAPPSATGSTAALARAGLNIDLNGVQPSVAQGARTYTSLLRIANTGTTEGTISVRLSNEATGAILGTYTSPSIPAGGSLQVTSAQLEVGAGVTPAASVLYRARVTGAIVGYVQHVNWNQDAGFFSDLSARRSGVTTP